MTVTGSSPIVRNPGGAAGAFRIDHLYWNQSGMSDSDDFAPVPVAEGETLVCWAWWQIDPSTDLRVSLMIDHAEVEPEVVATSSSVESVLTGSFVTSVTGLAAGDHTVGLSSDAGAILPQGGVVVMHVPSGSFFLQANLGG